jgi:hypothetical protein
MDIFTIQDVVRATGISTNTAHLHIQRGNLRAILKGHTFVIDGDEYRRFIAARLTGQYTRQGRKAQRA